MNLHSQKDCPYWMRGFCKNEKCRMKHDLKLKGSSSKRRRSGSPNESPDESLKQDEKKADIYYNSTIEERFNKQNERNDFLAKSLAGISAELKTLSRQQLRHPVKPSGSQAQT